MGERFAICFLKSLGTGFEAYPQCHILLYKKRSMFGGIITPNANCNLPRVVEI